MTGRFFTNWGWLPRNDTAFFKFYDLVDSLFAAGQLHGEALTDAVDALALISMGEVVVTIKLRVPRGIGDQFEDLGGWKCDFTFSADNTLFRHGSTLPLVTNPV